MENEASGNEVPENKALETRPAKVAPFKRPVRRALSERYWVLVPMTFAVLAVVLLAIGCWAGGAMMYMAQVTPMEPEEVHYPLIAWSLDVGTIGGYTQASRLMAQSMLAGFPVGLGLLVMAEMLRRRRRGTGGGGRGGGKRKAPHGGGDWGDFVWGHRLESADF